MIIAVDGPAAAGKGTLGKQLSHTYELRYLDTGALYRAVALAVRLAGEDAAKESAVVVLAENLDLKLTGHKDLRAEETGAIASKISAYPGVRAALFDLQRAVATHPGEGFKGALLDGRDIGTVICPDADLKLFITASAEARAERRLKDERARGNKAADFDQLLADIKKRDEQDQNREEAPLKPAEDAYLIDTTNLSIEAAFSTGSALVDALIKQQI